MFVTIRNSVSGLSANVEKVLLHFKKLFLIGLCFQANLLNGEKET